MGENMNGKGTLLALEQSPHATPVRKSEKHAASQFYSQNNSPILSVSCVRCCGPCAIQLRGVRHSTQWFELVCRIVQNLHGLQCLNI